VEEIQQLYEKMIICVSGCPASSVIFVQSYPSSILFRKQTNKKSFVALNKYGNHFVLKLLCLHFHEKIAVDQLVFK